MTADAEAACVRVSRAKRMWLGFGVDVELKHFELVAQASGQVVGALNKFVCTLPEQGPAGAAEPLRALIEVARRGAHFSIVHMVVDHPDRLDATARLVVLAEDGATSAPDARTWQLSLSRQDDVYRVLDVVLLPPE
jgi:hypothetical protein